MEKAFVSIYLFSCQVTQYEQTAGGGGGGAKSERELSQVSVQLQSPDQCHGFTHPCSDSGFAELITKVDLAQHYRLLLRGLMVCSS